MNHWILKTDSDVYPFEHLEREQRTRWDGVSNAVALRNIRNMAPGDPLMIYHSGASKEIVGLARVVSEPYPDPKQPDLAVVDIEVDRRLPKAVPLSSIKVEAMFAQSPLVRQPRLSVIPVSEEQWRRLLAMSGLE